MLNLPIVSSQVTLRGNVGFVDVFRAAHLFKIGPRGQGNALKRVGMVPKNQQKIGDANGIPSLFIVPTQVMLWNNVGSLDASRASQLFTFGAWGLIMH